MKAICLNNIGWTLYNNKRYNESLIFLEKALLLRNKLNDKYGIASTLENMGSVFDALGDTTKAMDCFFNAIQINLDEGFRKKAASSLLAKGITYFNDNEFEKAIQYFKNSLEIASEINLRPEIKDNYKYLSESFAGIKDFENAYIYSKLYIDINDTLNALNKGLFKEEPYIDTVKNNSSSSIFADKKPEKEKKFNGTILWVLFGALFIVAILFFSVTKKNNKDVNS